MDNKEVEYNCINNCENLCDNQCPCSNVCGSCFDHKYDEVIISNRVVTGEVVDITCTSAKIVCNAFRQKRCSNKVRTVGVQYGITPNLEDESKVRSLPKSPFDISLTELEPETTYYYRAFIVIGHCIYVGKIKKFTTPACGQPLVVTGTAQDIAATYANIVNNSYQNIPTPITEIGNEYSTDMSFTSYDHVTAQIIETPYDTEIIGLQPSTTYYYRAYVIANGIKYYGEIKQFTTLSRPTVITGDSTSVTRTSAVIVNNVYSGIPGTIASVGVQYATNPYLTGGLTTNASSIATPYNINLTGLLPGTTYYYRAVVVADGILYYGDIKSFVTAKAPTVNSGEVVDFTTQGLSIVNNTYENTVMPVTATGVEVATDKDYVSKVTLTGSTLSSPFSVKFSPIEINVQYWYRAYIITEGTKYYGVSKLFKIVV